MTTLAFPIVFLGAIMTGELAKAGDATHAIISGVMTFNGILIMIAGSRRKPVNMG